MKRIILPLIFVLFAAGCNDLPDKAKRIFHSDLKKVDSLTEIAADSLKLQFGREQQESDTLLEEKKEFSQEQIDSTVTATYQKVLKLLQKNDSLLLGQYCYYKDSVLALENRGIFKVVVMEPSEIIFDYIPEEAKAFECKASYEKFPELTEIGWTKEGCFIEKEDVFHDFSAVIDLAKDTGLEIPKSVEDKVKNFETHKVYKVLNTYFGIVMYFVFENGRAYLTAVDLNYTDSM